MLKFAHEVGFAEKGMSAIFAYPYVKTDLTLWFLILTVACKSSDQFSLDRQVIE